MNNIKLNKITSLGVLCTMAFFVANSAFAVDYTLGGSYVSQADGTSVWQASGYESSSFVDTSYYSREGEEGNYTYTLVTSPVSGTTYYIFEGDDVYTETTCETYYTYADQVYTAIDYADASVCDESLYTWTNDTPNPDAVTIATTYENMTIGAGTTYTYSSNDASTKLTVSGSLYLYGNEEANAKITVNKANTVANFNDVYLNYGTFTQAANSTVTMDDVYMTNGSTLSSTTGALSVTSITMDDSTLNLNGNSSGANSRSFTATTIIANGTSTISIDSDQVAVTITNLTMNDSSTLSKTAKGLLTFNGALTMNGSSSFSKSAGSLTFADGSSISMNGGAFYSNATSLNGTGTISLALASVDLTGDTATATILGSINLGTVTYESAAVWTIKLDVSNVLDDYIDDFTVDLSDLITISSASNLYIDLVDSEGNTYGDYSASLSGSSISFTYEGAAVPEPSTYAMIFGVVALGFAYYRRRK